jgi:effector-binding domain-containing protein
VQAGTLPGGRVARVEHHGSFDALGASWERLATWMNREGHTPSDTFWEVYVTEPSPDMDPADLVTELSWLLA